MIPTPSNPAPPASKSPAFRPVVLAPTYNNASTLISILERVEATGLEILVVNDGATDRTAALLADWTSKPRRVRVTVITHAKNAGKAEALATGFDAAAKAGYTHVATIDTDGQLDPESLPGLIDLAHKSPRALVLGTRSEHIEGYPGRSLVGRRLSNLAIRCEAGLQIEDSQCGLRVYPLELLAATKCKAGRYAFEAEILTRAAWAGFPVEQVEVPCRYFPKEERISHFKPGRDSLSGLGLHLRLMGEALLPWKRPVRRAPAARHSSPLDATADGSLDEDLGPDRTPLGLLRRFGAWINPLDVWSQIRRDPIARSQVAIGISLGAFIANLPIYGLQTISCFYVARRLHLHPLPVLLGGQLSTPPLAPLLIAAGIATGHGILHGQWVTPEDFDPAIRGFWQVVGSTLVDWTVGGIVLGTAMALLSFLIATVGLRLIPFREDHDSAGVDGASRPAQR